MPEIGEDGWDWEEDSERGERTLPRVTEIRSLDNSLTPTPPKGWWKVYRYDTALPVDSLDPASWLICIATVQQWEAAHPSFQGKRHMICRDSDGWRVLVVHPDLVPATDDAIDSLNSILTHCNCGGYDCIEPTLQRRAAKVFTRRVCDGGFLDPHMLPELLRRQDVDPDLLRWPTLPFPRRAELIHDDRLDPEALLEDRHWLDVVQQDSGLFTALSRDMVEAVFEPEIFFEAGDPPP